MKYTNISYLRIESCIPGFMYTVDDWAVLLRNGVRRVSVRIRRCDTGSALSEHRGQLVADSSQDLLLSIPRHVRWFWVSSGWAEWYAVMHIVTIYLVKSSDLLLTTYVAAVSTVGYNVCRDRARTHYSESGLKNLDFWKFLRFRFQVFCFS